jgi:endonuclease/exonuclease/phosphatase family metal-dependent hydrolase
MKRRLVLGFVIAAVLLAAGIFVLAGFASPAAVQQEPPVAAPVATAPQTVGIGSYNIQSFGPTKVGRPNTFAALAAVASRFDVLAVQEVGSNGTPADATAEQVMTAYVDRLNSLVAPASYAYVRANQFAILYRADLFELVSWGSYSGGETFAYPPLAAYLRVRGAPLDFVIVSVHVRPSEAKSEIAALRKAAGELSARFSESDVILLGDFNADGSYYDEGAGPLLSGFPDGEFFTVVPNDADTTVGEETYAYDRMELSAAMSEDWLGSWSVLHPADFVDISVCEGSTLNAGTEAALSDHYPIRAEFSTASDDD